WSSSRARSARASCDALAARHGRPNLVPPGDPPVVLPPLTSVAAKPSRVGGGSVTKGELLAGSMSPVRNADRRVRFVEREGTRPVRCWPRPGTPRLGGRTASSLLG